MGGGRFALEVSRGKQAVEDADCSYLILEAVTRHRLPRVSPRLVLPGPDSLPCRLSLGPVVGEVTATSARVLAEVRIVGWPAAVCWDQTVQ